MKLLSRKTIAASFAVMLSVSFGAAFVVAPAASATAHCASGRVCLWDGTGFSGTTLSMTSPALNQCKTIPYSWAKNIMSSTANATSNRIAWFNGDNCSGGTIWYQAANTESSSIGTASNKAQSFRPI